jgi:hypothetical protein
MTKKELEKILIEKKVPANTYSLDGKFYPDRFELRFTTNEWMVFYCDERGVKHDLKTFEREEEACRYFYEYLTGVLFG